MLKLSLILMASVGLTLASKPTETSSKSVPVVADPCGKSKQMSIESLLHAEKSRSFINAVATCHDCGLERVRHVRWLPVYYDENGKTLAHFYLLEGNFTANQAWQACQKIDGGQLASLHTPKRLEYVNKFLVAGNYWMGLQRWPKFADFIWSNGQTLGKTTTYWASSSEPREHGSAYDCTRTVTPPDMLCNATDCQSATYATWKSEKCDSDEALFSALCETPYPRPLYGLITGKFDWKTADASCKSTFRGLMNPGLARPKYLADFNSLLNTVNLHYKKWDCWVGFERFQWNESWSHRWIDGSVATRFTHMPMLHDQNYTYWTDTQTCVSLYDPYYAASLSYASQGFYNYNNCDTQLNCAICEWHWPL